MSGSAAGRLNCFRYACERRDALREARLISNPQIDVEARVQHKHAVRAHEVVAARGAQRRRQPARHAQDASVFYAFQAWATGVGGLAAAGARAA